MIRQQVPYVVMAVVAAIAGGCGSTTGGSPNDTDSPSAGLVCFELTGDWNLAGEFQRQIIDVPLTVREHVAVQTSNHC